MSFNLKERQRLTLPPLAVPSALIGLTSLFGMGRGETYRYNHLKILVVGYWFIVVGIIYQSITSNYIS